jgi:hypothetical protein
MDDAPSIQLRADRAPAASALNSRGIYSDAAFSLLLFTMLLIDWQVRFNVTQRAMTELFLIFAATFPRITLLPVTAKR